MRTPETVKVLEKAKRLVSKGWCQGHFQTSDSVCAAGALAHEGDLPYRCLKAAIGGRGVIDWNDTLGRTQQEVIDAFDRAIRIAKAAGV